MNLRKAFKGIVSTLSESRDSTKQKEKFGQLPPTFHEQEAAFENYSYDHGVFFM
jgi:hypothetical protein